MGENAELQEEELEVLKSIYEGDEAYRCSIIAIKEIISVGNCRYFTFFSIVKQPIQLLGVEFNIYVITSVV